MNFPKRLIDGYGAFSPSGRLQPSSSRYRELAEHGQTPEIMVIGCCNSRVSPEVIFDAGPGELFVVAQRRQSRAALYDRRRASTRVGGAGIRRAGAEGQAHRRARPRPLRRHPRLCRGRRAALAGRFHRPLDVDDRAGRESGRPARRARRSTEYLDARWSRRRSSNTLDNLMTFPRRAPADRARRGETARAPISASRPASCRSTTRRPALRARRGGQARARRLPGRGFEFISSLRGASAFDEAEPRRSNA